MKVLNVREITHFYSKDKLTSAANHEGKHFPTDFSLNQLETQLNARVFLRIHRNSLLNVNFVSELHGWFSGKILVRLKNEKRTELTISRDRVKILKHCLGMK